MPRLRRLSGQDVIAFLRQFGFTVQAQRGSHVKLSRMTTKGERQMVTIPNHRELDRGTLRAIFRQVSRFVSEQELWPGFYSD